VPEINIPRFNLLTQRRTYVDTLSRQISKDLLDNSEAVGYAVIAELACTASAKYLEISCCR
jgi:hypothetical protein